MRSSPSGGSNDLKRLYLLALAAAKRSVDITTPYFVTDESTLWSLEDAVRRGVKIRVLMEGDLTDAMPVKYASRHMYDRLLAAGHRAIRIPADDDAHEDADGGRHLEHLRVGELRQPIAGVERRDEPGGQQPRPGARVSWKTSRPDLKATHRIDARGVAQASLPVKDARAILDGFRRGVLPKSARRPATDAKCRHPMSASASLRRPPDICTSAARARRSSTGCSPAVRRHVRAAHRRHRRRALVEDMVAGILDGLALARARLGRRARRRRSARAVLQSERLDQYRAMAERLVAEGKAYRCYCTPERLQDKREAAEAAGGGWKYDRMCRSLTAERSRRSKRRARRAPCASTCPRAGRRSTIWCTAPITFHNANIEDFVVLRSDGSRCTTSPSSPTTSTWAITLRDARRRSHLEHAEAGPALPGARAPCPRSRTCR